MVGLHGLADARGLKITPSMAEEGYALSVTDEGAVLIAETDAGLFYGVQTIRQLLEPARGSAQIPRVRIHDWPTMRIRGVHNDQSRGQVPTLETAKRIVDFCAYYKMNLYGPYIEHTFAWAGHSDIWKGSGAWTAEEFVELCKYARPRHVMIVPQFEAFGHQSHILTKERYKHMAETDGWSFAPAVEDTYKLLDDLIGQMDKAFPFHPYFGIGCDEVYDMGKGKSKELMDKLGGPGHLFAYHITRVNEILHKYGRRGMMWGDMMLHHPETMQLIPKDVIILDWHYGAAAHYPSVKRFREAGFDVVVCPGVSGWVRIFPDLINAFANIQSIVADGQEAGALGLMNTSWGDAGAENFINYNWLPWAWGAACAWADAHTENPQRFLSRFARTFYGSLSDELARAQWRLAEAQRAYPWGGWSIEHFHGDPFRGKLANNLPAPSRISRFKQLLDEVEQLLARGEKYARRNAETLPYLRHALLRLRYVYDRATGLAEAADAYSDAYDAPATSDARREGITKTVAILRRLRAELAAVRQDFARLWLAEDRPQGLDYDLRKFDAQLQAYDWAVRQLDEALKTGQLPDPRSI
ncbi:MAG: family 20 glycosylhydrolase, partial [Armatimonadetes bacterium]|nr:family 20 glycosylhydrolase [Armatimonadota bacterium]